MHSIAAVLLLIVGPGEIPRAELAKQPSANLETKYNAALEAMHDICHPRWDRKWEYNTKYYEQWKKIEDRMIAEYPENIYPDIYLTENPKYCSDDTEWYIEVDRFSITLRQLRRLMKSEGVEVN